MANNVCNTNADTCCLGKNYVILNNTSRTANVYAYDTSIKTLKGVTIVSRATAYDDLGTNTPYILVIDKDLYYGNKLDHSVINPNQVRAYRINFWDNTFDRQRGLTIAFYHRPRTSKSNFTIHYAEGHEISNIDDWLLLQSGQDVRHQTIEWQVWQ